MLKQALLIGGTAITIVGIGVGLFLYSKKSKIEEYSIEKLLSKLENKRTKLVDNMKDFDGWAIKWIRYLTANSDNGKPRKKDILELKDWEKVKDSKEVPESFANKCKNLEELKVKDEKDLRFKNYIDWCTK